MVSSFDSIMKWGFSPIGDGFSTPFTHAQTIEAVSLAFFSSVRCFFFVFRYDQKQSNEENSSIFVQFVVLHNSQVFEFHRSFYNVEMEKVFFCVSSS